MKPRKVPMRMCVGCKTMKPKRELSGVVGGDGDTAVLDKTSKALGPWRVRLPRRGLHAQGDEGAGAGTRAAGEVDETLLGQFKREMARRELQRKNI